MEINTQQLEALLQLQEQQAQLPRRSGNPAQGFDALLNDELAADIANTGAVNPLAAREAQGSMYSQMLLNTTEANEALSPEAAVLQAAFDQASGTLDLWDRYARTLGASPTDTALRDAYSLLEGIDTQVMQLRASPAASASPELNSLINELEVLAATEKFKFNRGDYI